MANTTYNAPQKGASKTAEYSGGKHASVPAAGLYRHPQSGKEAFVQGDPLYGNTMAQGFVRLGFEFVREAEPGEIKSLPELQARERDAEASTLKGLNARLADLEEAAAGKSELEKEVADLRRKLAEKEEADKLAAEEKTKVEEVSKAVKDAVDESAKASTDPALKESGDNAKANAEAETKNRQSATGSTNQQINGRNNK